MRDGWVADLRAREVQRKHLIRRISTLRRSAATVGSGKESLMSSSPNISLPDGELTSLPVSCDAGSDSSARVLDADDVVPDDGERSTGSMESYLNSVECSELGGEDVRIAEGLRSRAGAESTTGSFLTQSTSEGGFCDRCGGIMGVNRICSIDGTRRLVLESGCPEGDAFSMALEGDLPDKLWLKLRAVAPV